jgi:hypothetical protein
MPAVEAISQQHPNRLRRKRTIPAVREAPDARLIQHLLLGETAVTTPLWLHTSGPNPRSLPRAQRQIRAADTETGSRINGPQPDALAG